MIETEDYKKVLESMSKEELISEIGRLLVDKGLLLSSMDGYINELKEDNSRLNGLLADGTEVMDYWQDKYLEEKSKNDELQKQIEQLLEERVTIDKNYLQECEEHLKTVQIVKELQKKTDELKEELEEKNTYEEKLNSMIDNLRDDISEQKAEIKRLTEKIPMSIMPL